MKNSTLTSGNVTNKTIAKKVLGLIDLTSLNEGDTEQHITRLCHNASNELGNVAAICIYSPFIAHARALLEKSNINIATVVNFPNGHDDVVATVTETREAIGLGADEVDMVLPYRALLQGNTKVAEQMVRECKLVCGEQVKLKVIIESGELKTAELIQIASQIALENGADFIKTSTGKVPVNATLEAAQIMLNCIKSSGNSHAGFKAAGGIKTIQDAMAYLDLADQIMGEEWVNPDHFRFGASSLLESVLQFAGQSVSHSDSNSNY